MTEFLWIAVKSTIKFLSYDLNSQQKKMFMEVLRFRMIEELHSAEELSNSSWHQRPTSNIHFQISKSQSKFISISTPIERFFFHPRHLALIPQFHAFVGSLRNLTHLKLSNCCTDQLLAVIGANCRNLEVLDAEEDSGKRKES